jgi:hypothetical protein
MHALQACWSSMALSDQATADGFHVMKFVSHLPGAKQQAHPSTYLWDPDAEL